jgi:hypothetical protein
MYVGVKDRGAWSAAMAADPLTNAVNAAPKIHFLTVI